MPTKFGQLYRSSDIPFIAVQTLQLSAASYLRAEILIMRTS